MTPKPTHPCIEVHSTAYGKGQYHIDHNCQCSVAKDRYSRRVTGKAVKSRPCNALCQMQHPQIAEGCTATAKHSQEVQQQHSNSQGWGLANQADLDNLRKILDQCCRVMLGQPLDTGLKLLLVALPVSDVTQVSYQLHCVQSILLPSLQHGCQPVSSLQNNLPYSMSTPCSTGTQLKLIEGERNTVAVSQAGSCIQGLKDAAAYLGQQCLQFIASVQFLSRQHAIGRDPYSLTLEEQVQPGTAR